MKLKTLKDIEEDCINATEPGWSKAEIFEKLKAEAVKWVEEDLRCYDEMFNNPGDIKQTVLISTEARIEWIKHFFNLTEEDLE